MAGTSFTRSTASSGTKCPKSPPGSANSNPPALTPVRLTLKCSHAVSDSAQGLLQHHSSTQIQCLASRAPPHLASQMASGQSIPSASTTIRHYTLDFGQMVLPFDSSGVLSFFLSLKPPPRMPSGPKASLSSMKLSLDTGPQPSLFFSLTCYLVLCTRTTEFRNAFKVMLR